MVGVLLLAVVASVGFQNGISSVKFIFAVASGHYLPSLPVCTDTLAMGR